MRDYKLSELRGKVLVLMRGRCTLALSWQVMHVTSAYVTVQSVLTRQPHNIAWATLRAYLHAGLVELR